jgi:hypothetical protein
MVAVGLNIEGVGANLSVAQLVLRLQPRPPCRLTGAGDQVRPYTFNIQPFVVDDAVAQQAYVSSEVFQVQKAGAGIAPSATATMSPDRSWRPEWFYLSAPAGR